MSCPNCGARTVGGDYFCDACKEEWVRDGKMCECGITGDRIRKPGEHHFYNCSLYTGSKPYLIPLTKEEEYNMKKYGNKYGIIGYGGPDGQG